MKLRSLYAKIFIWFCATSIATTVIVAAAAGILGTQPFGQRWMALTQDLYAHTAVDIYTQSGPQALSLYLARIDAGSGIEGHLVLSGHSATDVLGRPLPSSLQRVLADATRKQKSAARLGRVWLAATPVRSVNGVAYTFAMQVHPFSRFLDGTFARAVFLRLALAVLLIALFCLLLARHITQPIRMLEASAARLAGGDLTVRSRPSLGDRSDELSAMAEAFDRMAARIETLLHTQQQMLADISHELRSPLTRISVSLELLRRGETDVVPSMQADLDRLNTMIAQVLQLTRLVDPSPPGTAPVDLAALLQAICDDANREGRSTNRRVQLHACSACSVQGDAALLHSALENIIRNALQHTPAGNDVQLTLSRQSLAGHAPRAVIEVRDSGPGAPEESLPQLFAPFFRVPNSRNTHPEGSGLGLSIAARIIAHHHGAVTASNLQPHGLLVRVQLPSLS